MAFGISAGAYSAIAAIGALGVSTYSTIEQSNAQKKSRKLQSVAQQLSQNAAAKQERINEEGIRKANRKQPNVAALLAEQQLMRPPSTVLTTSNLLGSA